MISICISISLFKHTYLRQHKCRCHADNPVSFRQRYISNFTFLFDHHFNISINAAPITYYNLVLETKLYTLWNFKLKASQKSFTQSLSNLFWVNTVEKLKTQGRIGDLPSYVLCEMAQGCHYKQLKSHKMQKCICSQRILFCKRQIPGV